MIEKHIFSIQELIIEINIYHYTFKCEVENEKAQC